MMSLIKTININKMLNKKEDSKEVSTTLDTMLKQIKESEKIAIFTHESPDGDAIGCALAMNLAIKEMEKTSDVYLPEYSRLFSFLPAIEEVKTDLTQKQYDLVISVDCADLKRVVGKEWFENAKKTISIDHHGSNQMFGDINFVNPAAPACAEVLISIFEYFGIEITKDIGKCLLTGIITDTGGFQYPGITAETFEFVAFLIRKGIDVPEVYKKSLQTTTKATFELSKRVMDRIEFLENGKVTFTYITKKDEEEVNAEPGDHEGLVNIGRDVEGVEISIFIREKETDLYKVSLRSKESTNVSDIALMFGGGGHIRAAGCAIKGDIQTVKEKLMKEIKKVI